MRFLLFLLAGLTGSGHCAGMCGPFPAALGGLASPAGAPGGAARRRAALRQGLYHAGKIATYVFLGVLAATLGLRLERVLWPLGIAAGLLLLLVGLAGLLPAARGPRLARWLLGFPLCGALAGLLRDPRPLAPLAFGLFNGFLPCGLVYGAVALAASSGSPSSAALSMLCFGLGTAPALLLMGLLSEAARARLAGRLSGPALARAAALLTALLGAATLARALLPAAAHAHHLLALAGR